MMIPVFGSFHLLLPILYSNFGIIMDSILCGCSIMGNLRRYPSVIIRLNVLWMNLEVGSRVLLLIMSARPVAM